jgi:hypothetical protein
MEQSVKDSDTGKGERISEVILNVPLKGGKDCNVICLIEQQQADDNNLAARMFDSAFRLRASSPAGNITCFAIYTGDAEDVSFYTETYFSSELSLKFRTFHIPSYNVEELSRDRRPFARVMYAARKSYEIGDDEDLRKKYARELLNFANDESYDDRQRKYILDFSKRILRLKELEMSDDLKEAYNMKMISLEEASEEIVRQEGIMIGVKKGVKKGKVENQFETARRMLARNVPISDIVDFTGLKEQDVLTIQ